MTTDEKHVIERLVSIFADHRDAYRDPSYRETQLRREFIDPMWKALGWDIDNEAGYAPQYKDVIHEDAIKVSADAFTKAPDYCFRIGGVRKFFLEAKKPSVDVKDDPEPAYQLRRYAWSQKLPLSVLTDFEELAVYDTRVKPELKDSASRARVKLIPFTEYVERWDEIADLLSREAVLKGAFDKYAETAKKKGAEAVDEAFLDEIEEWRTDLAKNLAARNKKITQAELNFAVQAIIDRIIFLRICEDRGIEQYGTLQGLANGTNTYGRLVAEFTRADRKYNSGLFHFSVERGRASSPDTLTPRLDVDDAVLKRIIKAIYYPSPYEFSVIPADILGQVYEQFLGKVIRLTTGHQAKVEEKPEVRKAGGVYYTPTYIVDYILKQTLGRLLKGKTPKQVAGGKDGPIRVLDPACGSGTFLLQAYQFLLDWYRDAYVNESPGKHAKGKAPVLYEAAGGEWRLTTGERKRVLLTHIFGVDIDFQAVEVTKLSLLLKVLEGESDQTLQRTFQLFHERALPDLDNNVKCGNSLVGPDFWEGQQLAIFDEEERHRINAFDWHAEFPAVFQQGGFDAVIGNPPYLSYSGRQSISLSEEEQRYYDAKYSGGGWPTAHGLFIERAVRDLAARMVAYIVPDQVGHLDGYQMVRDVVAQSSNLAEVRYWGERVFAGVITPALTFVADKEFVGKGTAFSTDGAADELVSGAGVKWTARSNNELLRKAQQVGQSLGEMVADPGVHTGNCSENLVFPLTKTTKALVPVLEGKQIARYYCAPPTKGLNLRYRAKEGEYFTVRPKEKYARAPFVIRQTAAYPIVGPRRHATYFRNSLLALYPPPEPLDVRFFVGILNSYLIRQIYSAMVQESQQRTFPQVKIRALRQLPIYWPNMEDPRDRAFHDRVALLVQQMLDLQERFASAHESHNHAFLEREIEALDRQIDSVVFELYGTTPDEVDSLRGKSLDVTDERPKIAAQ